MKGLVVVFVELVVLVFDLFIGVIDNITWSPSFRPDVISVLVASAAPTVTRVRCIESPDFTHTTTGRFIDGTPA
jgi:hypothetical protein